MSKGVLFDVDGTLCDTNYLHAVAWAQALRESGHFVNTATIHHHMGMGSDNMLTELLGRNDESLADLHSRRMKAFADDIVAFPGARELLHRVAHMNLLVVLATSASDDEYQTLRRVLDSDDVLHEKTNGSEIDSTKPSPDIFSSALGKSGLDASDALVVGDTVWDIEAAHKAGLRTIAVLSGGISREQLEGAGAIAVYEDVSGLLDDIDNSPIADLAR